MGAYTAGGACGGDFYTCNCSYAAPYVSYPGEFFNQDQDEFQPNTFYVWWDMYNIDPYTYSDCSVTSCGGVHESAHVYNDLNVGYGEIFCEY